MKNNCIDAGREGCPCALAESGNCLVCGRLSGGSCEDCSWQGACIYTLYEQNERRLIKSRREQTLPVEEVRVYSESFYVFVLRADRGFCQKAQTAGAYVFVRPAAADQWYGMPVSVLKSEPDKGLIHLGICRCGPKSSGIFEEREQLSVRGVYYNALSGLSELKDNAEETVIFAKGIALAPLRNLLDGGSRYRRKLSHLHMYVDIDKVGMDFFLDYFGDLPAGAVQIRQFAREDLCGVDELRRLGRRAENGAADNILVLASPYYVRRVQKTAGSKAVRPTEGSMCCGEGICGACTYSDEKGNTVRRCKLRV